MTGPLRMRRIARGAASAIEREDGRPDPLRFLARLGCGWVPNHCAECVCLGAAPIIWLDWDKISHSDADHEDSVGPRGNPHREEDQRQRQKPHSACPKWLILTRRDTLGQVPDNEATRSERRDVGSSGYEALAHTA